jgi:putative phosphoesterase
LKIAIIADAHGNYQAIQEFFNHVENEKPDMIISAGDMLNPFPDGKEVYKILKERNIKCLKGNNDEYLIFHKNANASDPLKFIPRFLPVQYASNFFNSDEINELEKLPLSISISAGNNEGLLICHGTPFDPWKSISDKKSESLLAQFRRTKENNIIAAHYHVPWRGNWNNKNLILCGSCRFPMTGKPESEYLIAEHYNKKWNFRDIQFSYDRKKHIQNVLNSDYLEQTGPVGWLIFADFLFLEDHLMDFFRNEFMSYKPETYKELSDSVKKHFVRTKVIEEFEAITKIYLN